MELTQEYLKRILVYSHKRGVFTWITPPKTHADLIGENAGFEQKNRSGKFYHIIQIDGVKYYRSHLAFLFMTGSMPSGDVVDHINGNSLDDRWLNLRSTSHTVNSQNRFIGKKGRSLPIGVKKARSGRFCARITVEGEQIQIGTFDSIVDASNAYMNAKRKYHAPAFN